MIGEGFCEICQSFDPETAFALLDPLFKGFKGVFGQDGDFALSESCAVVVLLIDIVDCYTGYGFARVQHCLMNTAAVHSPAAELGEQRRMAVEHTVVVAGEGSGTYEAHIPCKQHKIHANGFQRANDGFVQGFRLRVGY